MGSLMILAAFLFGCQCSWSRGSSAAGHSLSLLSGFPDSEIMCKEKPVISTPRSTYQLMILFLPEVRGVCFLYCFLMSLPLTVSLSSLCLQSSVPRSALVLKASSFLHLHICELVSSLKHMSHEQVPDPWEMWLMAALTDGVVESGIPEYLCALKSWRVPLSPVTLSSPAYFNFSHAQFGVSEGAELCFPSRRQEHKLPLIWPWLHTDRNTTLHISWVSCMLSGRQLWFSLGCSRCYSSLVVWYPGSY